MTTSSPERLHALDALRASALLLGVVLHATLSFFPTTGVWLIADTDRSSLMSGLFFVIHTFRMPLFFLLAGLFGRMMYQRMGAGRFALNRFKRIGLPFVSLWPLMFVAFIALFLWGMTAMYGPLPEGEAPPLNWRTVPLSHLWFLYVLLLIYPVAILTALAARIMPGANALGRGIDALIASLAKTPLLIVAPAVLVGTAIFNDSSGPIWFGVRSPDMGLLPNMPALVTFPFAFFLGWMMQRQLSILDQLKRIWFINLGVAALATAGCFALVGFNPDLMMALLDSKKALFGLAYGVAMWGFIFGFVGLFQAIMSHHSAVWRYLADSSYWVYLMHLPLVVALQIWMFDWVLPAEMKLVLILLIATPILLISYHLLVRGTFIGWILNGRTKPVFRRT